MTPPTDWLEANRRYLLAALTRVREALERHVARRAGATPGEISAFPQDDSTDTFALDFVVRRFGLSPFERDTLLLAAGPELEGRFDALIAAANNDARLHPTFSLALSALPEAHWSAVTPMAPLRRWRLLELDQGPTLMSSALRVDERVLHFLVGTPYSDERLLGIVESVSRSVRLPPERVVAAADAVDSWRRSASGGSLPVLTLHGADAPLRRLIAAEVASAAGSHLLAVQIDTIARGADERRDLLRRVERECALTDAILLLERSADSPDTDADRSVSLLLEAMAVPVMISGEHAVQLPSRSVMPLEVAALTHPERRDAWGAALGDGAPELNGALERITAQFRLGVDAIAAVGSTWRDTDADPEKLWSICRTYARPHLSALAERIDPKARWDDLVLPAPQLDALRSVALHVRHRALVDHSWGFAARSDRGNGITALFAGPSGTGKTMAAEVLANELQLDLHRIDLSQVVSKYIGETEKNLRRVFDAAEGGASILLFDEADALFAKRTSDVKDSHDRYARIEVGYLLQRMEAYHGLAILTTNMASTIDTAFLRRLRFSITFPFPDAAARVEIWRRAFPAATPLDGLDLQRLARLNIAGGNIRNVALHAAFYAADAGAPVRMPHLLRAARLEYAKLERPLTETETGGWS